MDMDYEYDGRICSVINTFVRPLTSKNINAFTIMAAIVMFDGECKTVEWKSLKAKPAVKDDLEWQAEHIPIEYFGAVIALKLRDNGMTTMHNLSLERAKECDGIGPVSMEIIEKGFAKYLSDFESTIPGVTKMLLPV